MSTEAAPLALRDRNRQRVRHDILDAVAESLGELGYSGTTLEEIRTRAGVSRATLYAYFAGGREEMVREAYLRTAEEVYARAVEYREAAGDAPSRITAMARALIDVTVTPAGRFYGGMGPDIVAVVSGVMGGTSRSAEDLIRQDLCEARDAGRLDASAPVDALASCLVGVLRSAAAATARQPESAAEQLRAISWITRSCLGA